MREEGEKKSLGELEGVRETRSAEEVKREEDETRMRMRKRVDGLRRCPVCGGAVKGVIWGYRKKSVWVGCDWTEECYRHIVMKGPGWSFDEVCDEWERRNGKIGLAIKRVKGVWGRVFGGEAKRRKRDRMVEREREEKRRKGEAERKRVFGDFRVSVGFWVRVRKMARVLVFWK